MDMEDKNDIMLKQLFEQAAKQQIADNGFTERVMMNLPEVKESRVQCLARMWTLFCLIVAVGIFWFTSGWNIVEGFMTGGKHMLLNALEVFLLTAPTTEIQVNPWVILLLLGFVLVFLPYQTFRKLSATL